MTYNTMEDTKLTQSTPIKEKKTPKAKPSKAKATKASKPTDTILHLPTGRNIIVKYTTGRPPAVNDLVLKKLIKAFEMGCTDLEACSYAGISSPTLYAFEIKYPEFTAIKNELRLKPTVTARNTVTKAVGNSFEAAKWYLERKARSEFAPTTNEDQALSALALFTKVRKIVETDNATE